MCGFDTKEVPHKIGENTEFVDLTGNPYVKEGDPVYNKKYLILGEK